MKKYLNDFLIQERVSNHLASKLSDSNIVSKLTDETEELSFSYERSLEESFDLGTQNQTDRSSLSNLDNGQNIFGSKIYSPHSAKKSSNDPSCFKQYQLLSVRSLVYKNITTDMLKREEDITPFIPSQTFNRLSKSINQLEELKQQKEKLEEKEKLIESMRLENETLRVQIHEKSELIKGFENLLTSFKSRTKRWLNLLERVELTKGECHNKLYENLTIEEIFQRISNELIFIFEEKKNLEASLRKQIKLKDDSSQKIETLRKHLQGMMTMMTFFLEAFLEKNSKKLKRKASQSEEAKRTLSRKKLLIFILKTLSNMMNIHSN